MLKQAVKTVVVVAASAVAVPYTVAFLCNMMLGWPQGRDKYRRAFHPRKVYALNYAVLQSIAKLRYLGLYLRWKYFYANASSERVIKDLPYGNHENKLDLYFPRDHGDVSANRPVFIFVYGGTWSSGDKNMYSLLCCQMADHLNAIVCCPNYSKYPKGFVDDMVQDMVDCMAWIQQNAVQFGGDKDRLALIGHSAGAHLCVLSVLELTIKRLLHHPETVLLPLSGSPDMTFSRQSSAVFLESIRFDDKHFNGSNASSNDHSDVTVNDSFYVVEEKDHSCDKSFVVLEGDKDVEDESGTGTVTEASPEDTGDGAVGDSGQTLEESNDEQSAEGDSDQKKQVTFDSHGATSGGDTEQKPLGDTDDPVDDANEELSLSQETAEEQPELSLHQSEGNEEQHLTQAQLEASDILSSVKLVIGLAGVYHIAEHFEHESYRGVEDVSMMARAMYGSQHFHRLSPTLLVSELPEKIRLPPIQLIHGDKDSVVPLSSSLRLGQALWDKGCYDVSVSVMPGCNHYDVCLDLMDSKRSFHDNVMGEIMKAAQKCL